MRVWILGNPATVKDINEDGCPACNYANYHLSMKVGEKIKLSSATTDWEVKRIESPIEETRLYYCEEIVRYEN